MSEQRRTRVAVVFGGRSTEHAVSCASAGMILGAIDRSRYDVVPVGIAQDGRWVVLPRGDDPPQTPYNPGGTTPLDPPALEGLLAPQTPSAPQPPRWDPSGVPGGSVTPGSLPVLQTPSESAAVSPGQALRDIDVVLPVLHGTYGEDGTIQGLLEMTGVRYAGAGVLASAAGMDKEYMKLLFAARGLPVGPYVVVRDRDWTAGEAERRKALDEVSGLGFPVFVKPARGGSSIGTSRVDSADGLEAAISAAREHDRKVLVEAFVPGVEIECAVLEGVDGGAPDASLPGQVIVDPDATWYDFEAKYLGAGTGMEIPAPIPDADIEQIRQLACTAFESIDCEGLARVDFFYTTAGDILVNEINTMPGMTPASGFPRMWAATGLPLPELIDRIITTALGKPLGQGTGPR